MYIDGDWFWALSEREREDAYILTDTCCLLCGDSLEGHSFVQWYFHGPQLDLAGMHVPCAHTMCMGMLKDLAAAGLFSPDALTGLVPPHREPPYSEDRDTEHHA